jgi:putative endonuclease
VTNVADKKQRAEKRGRRAEWLAAWALRLKGYRILATRYKTPVGEVDIIARKGNLIALCEVKARNSLAMCHDAVSASAARRIEAAGDIWLSRQHHPERYTIRRDLIAVLPGKWPIHVPDAF